jgi:translation initiation factor 2 beta subunit (eIF-2beta)/eIF-5
LKFLDKFIEKYICCPKCRLPELHLRIRGDKKRGEIHGKCESCGFKGAMD